jgi:hypothetical protein
MDRALTVTREYESGGDRVASARRRTLGAPDVPWVRAIDAQHPRLVASTTLSGMGVPV